MNKQPNPLLTKREVAEELGGVSVSFVNQLLARRLLAKVRLSYRVCRIPRASVEQYIRERTMVRAAK
jgi:predicted DNA-binding transcriptional regulator AlpA